MSVFVVQRYSGEKTQEVGRKPHPALQIAIRCHKHPLESMHCHSHAAHRQVKISQVKLCAWY